MHICEHIGLDVCLPCVYMCVHTGQSTTGNRVNYLNGKSGNSIPNYGLMLGPSKVPRNSGSQNCPLV